MPKLCVAAAWLVLGSSVIGYGQDAPPKAQANAAPVATVLGKKITADDLRPPKALDLHFEAEMAKLNAEDAQARRKERREGALRSVVLSAMEARYVKEHHLEADEAEIRAHIEFMSKAAAEMNMIVNGERIKGIRKRLADPKLGDADRKKLTAEVASLEAPSGEPGPPSAAERREMRAENDRLREELKAPDLSEADRKALRDTIAMNERFENLTDEQAAVEWKKVNDEIRRAMAKGMIEDWKFKREIFKQYGGKIIFQQAGLEPVDAERMFLQEREKAGDFTIHDSELKEGFWRYWKRDHPFTTEKPTGHEFDKPWWAEERPAR